MPPKPRQSMRRRSRRSALVQGRGHLPVARQVVLRCERRRHRRFPRPASQSSTTSPNSASTRIWLLPFYPSPRRDDGYDIADYRDVHPDYGTLRDVEALHRAKRTRAALRVITELVINHTSDQHPWFQRARRAQAGLVGSAISTSGRTPISSMPTRASSSSTPRSRTGRGIRSRTPITGTASIAPAGSEFRQSRACSRRCLRVMRFWLDMGVDGLRLDAVPYLVEREGTNNENLPETHAILKRIRADARCGVSRPHAARRSQPVAGGRAAVFRRRRRMPHGVPFPADAAHVHGDRAGGPLPDHRHHAPDAGDSGRLPMGDLPAQSRRAHARNGHGQRARLSVEDLRGRPPRAPQSRHSPPARAAAASATGGASS